MSLSMLECVVFCEARADAEVAQLLVDRVLCDVHPWADGALDRSRRWRGDRHMDGPRDWWFVKWSDLVKRAKGRRFRMHGRYGGGSRGEYLQGRKALKWAALEFPSVSALVWLRDDDGCGRRPDYEAARGAGQGVCAVAIGVPLAEREAWSIVAFDPADERERRRVDVLVGQLGAHPRAVAHTLTPKADHHPRGTKRTLAALCDDDYGRGLDGLRALPLAALRARGEAVGLAAFLDDIERSIAPRLSHLRG